MGQGLSMKKRLATDRSVLDHSLSWPLFRRTLSFGRPYLGSIILFLLLVVVDAALGVAPPLLFKRIIDDGVMEDNATVVVFFAVVVGAVAILNAGITLALRWYSSSIGERLVFDLRMQVFDHVSTMPLAFFSRTHTGKLVSRVHSDVVGAQQAFTSTLSSLVSNAVGLALVFVAMMSLSWELTLGSLILLPVFVVPARMVGTKLAGLTRTSQQLNGEMSATMTERFSVSGALLVKLFGRREDEHLLFAEKAGGVRDSRIRISMVGRFFTTSVGLVAALATALVYGYGGLMALDDVLTVGTLTALAGLLMKLYTPLIQLSSARIDIMSAMVSFERVFEVLDLKPGIVESPSAVRASPSGSVEFRNVDFTYPDATTISIGSLEPVATLPEAGNTAVLHDITFRAERGQTVAIVGPSGSGKTTLTHLVARLYDADTGQILVGERDVRELTLESLSSVVGYVTQDAHMFHDTIRANLRYARPMATSADMWEALEVAQVADLVRRLPDGLDTMVGDRGYRLSGGERQRFAIARLLLKAPPIVVLDEATAHLDSESEVSVQRALDHAMANRTSIVIAHRLSTIRNADLILVMDQGRIVERGTHADLILSNGLYEQLYRAQFAGLEDQPDYECQPVQPRRAVQGVAGADVPQTATVLA